MNFSSQINTNAWLNASMIGVLWFFNALCFIYCIATAVFFMKMLLIQGA